MRSGALVESLVDRICSNTVVISDLDPPLEPSPVQPRGIKACIPSMMICNACSITKKIDELDCVINVNNVDLVCVTETWLSDETPDSTVAVRDFILLRKDRESHAGGVAAHVRSTIPCKRLSKLEPTEGICGHVDPAQTSWLYNHVQRIVDENQLNHPDCLIGVTCDFNPNATKISASVFRRSCGLTQIVLTRDTGTLDWYLTNLPKLFMDPTQVPKLGSSEHYCVLIRESDVCGRNRTKFTVAKRDIRDSCLQDFGRWITGFSWEEFFELPSCKEKFQFLKSSLSEATNRFLPLKT